MTRTGLKGRRAEAVLFSFESAASSFAGARSTSTGIAAAMLRGNSSVEGADLQYNKICGDYSGEVTPVPIPNTEVKLLCADDTWWETAWESRTLPLIFFLINHKRERLYPLPLWYNIPCINMLIRKAYT